ncbi:hypothetical protein LPJ55_000015 [Coemansia sp. RSA 990]|nr:hypothetical protein LPJ55_000015 [Coemansia sp. RSA 990]
MDTQVGTVSPHRHHLVVCNSSPDEWPSRVEGMSETITALARGSIRLPGRAMVTMSDFSPLQKPDAEQTTSADKYRRIDVAVLPLGLVAKQLDKDGVDLLLQWLGHEVLPTSWTPAHSNVPRPPFEHKWLELSQNRHIFVCTHGSRDYLCGHHGGKLLEDLRRLIVERNLQKHIAAWSTSHIGGHKYAANAIVYPRGDWYGTWCDKCRSMTTPGISSPIADAEAIINATLHDVTWWDAWRGAINMSKEDQIAAWSSHNMDAGHNDHSADSFSWNFLLLFFGGSSSESESEELSELELSELELESESLSELESLLLLQELESESLSELEESLSESEELSELELSELELESESLSELESLLLLQELESESLSELEESLSESEELSELELSELELESESLSELESLLELESESLSELEESLSESEELSELELESESESESLLLLLLLELESESLSELEVSLSESEELSELDVESLLLLLLKLESESLSEVELESESLLELELEPELESESLSEPESLLLILLELKLESEPSSELDEFALFLLNTTNQ